MVEPQNTESSSAQQPPPRSAIPSVGSSGTPTRKKQSSVTDHPRSLVTSSTKPDHHKFKEEMGREIHDAIVGGMPIEEFFSEFLPCRDNSGMRSFLNTISDDYFNAIPNTKPDGRKKRHKVAEDSDTDDDMQDLAELGDEEGSDITPPGSEITSSEQPEPPMLSVEEQKGDRHRRRSFVEKDMYPVMVDLLNEGKFCPNLTFVDNSKKCDPHSRSNRRWAPDIGTYKAGATPPNKETDFGSLQTFVELKIYGSALPFADIKEGATETVEERPYLPEESNKLAMSIIGQLGLLMTEICSRQYRTHVFLIFLRDPDVFFLRGDRSGVIVSRSCNFRTNSKILAEFLWLFGKLSEAERGLDPTVELANPAEEEIAKTNLDPPVRYPNQPIVRIHVPDGQTTRVVLARGSISEPDSLIGRGTRAMQVYDTGLNKICFLKDSWRAEGLEKETDILKELNAARVTNVPTVIAGGDLSDGPRASPNHRTRTQDYADRSWSRRSVGIEPTTFEARFQHRLLEDFIGSSITDSRDAKEMMQVVQGAVKAHRQAYDLKILHRDVSNNNVRLQRENGEAVGILSDWDLAIRFEFDHEGNIVPPKAPRQQFRTGTWYFMSALLLSSVTKVHTLQDDLESFFHLVFYLSIFWFPWSGLPGYTIKMLVSQFFDEYYYDDSQKVYIGGTFKMVVLGNLSPVKIANFEIPNNQPLTTWLRNIQRVFEEFYRNRETTPFEQLNARNHVFMLDELTRVLHQPGWPEGKLTDPLEVPVARGKRRRHNGSDQRGKGKKVKSDSDDYLPRKSRSKAPPGGSGSSSRRTSARGKKTPG